MRTSNANRAPPVDALGTRTVSSSEPTASRSGEMDKVLVFMVVGR
jgi:hypothetical protein